MIQSFKKRFTDKLNPNLVSIKYCQNINSASIEIQFLSISEKQIIDLKFMGGEIIENEDGTFNDILPLFDPAADIVDNASAFLSLDDYSMVICTEDIFTKEAIEKIVSDNENR